MKRKLGVVVKMAKKKRRYIDAFSGEVVTETRQTARKDEYTDLRTGKIRRRKKGSLF
jgi:RNase P/RNase MRP subunit p29